MIDDPYSEFRRDQMILRDWLALDRTVLANKRTFLAYARTAIALLVLGIALVKLVHHQGLEMAGFGLMAFGILTFVVGVREYRVNQKRFRRLLDAEKELDLQRQRTDGSGPPSGHKTS